MGLEIENYTKDMENAVKDFNKRLNAGGSHHRYNEKYIPKWLPKIDNRRIYQDCFLAVENETVRGAYMLKQQDYFINGNILSIADYHYPVSEGIINKKYSLVGVHMIMDALKRQPLLYGLGMGGYEESLPRMLAAMGWSMFSVPFYFKIINTYKFLKNITYLRKTILRKVLLNVLAYSGLGCITIKVIQLLSNKNNIKNNSTSFELVNDFSSWADDVWNVCKNFYSMIAVRDSTTLKILYPINNEKFMRLKILNKNKIIGWAVVIDTQMTNHKQFGAMRVGSIVDCLAVPEDSSKVIASATKYLSNRGVDIMVSNQEHASWGSALINAGFLKGPSNYLFAASKELTKLIQPIDVNKANIHLNRGDGDGPINL